MDKFAFLLKTYEKDFIYARRLLESFEKYNRENIHCYIVLPREMQESLMNSLNEKTQRNIFVLAEEEFGGLVDEDIHGIRPGYINQEIIKLSFWEKGLCENYCCLDSDAEFIRDFYIHDFMYDDKVPYSVLTEDKDLKADSTYYNAFWIEREKSLLKIQKELGLESSKLLTCHGFQAFSTIVLRDFKEKFMDVKGYSYMDLMKISPYEFTWYNLWLQKSKVIEIHPCEPFFKTFHMKRHLLWSKMYGMKLEDLKRSYVGIIINSNYTQGTDLRYGKHICDIWERLHLFWELLKSLLTI